jgi:hypothetical protein
MAFQDNELTDQEKIYVLLNIVYLDLYSMAYSEELISQAIWFVNGGQLESQKGSHEKLFDWEQDFPLIISAVNRVAGCEVRSLPYLHWWTFLSYWQEIGECLFTRVVDIRTKRNKRKKLESYEKEFYRNNREIIDFRKDIERQRIEQQCKLDNLWVSAKEGE